MNTAQEKHLRWMVGPGVHQVPAHISSLAQVVLEHAERIDMLTRRSEDVMPGFYAEPQVSDAVLATASATTEISPSWNTSTEPGLDNTGSLDIRVLADGEEALLAQPRRILRLEPNGPISAEELKRRGVDAELETRAIDVVMRCGWPRDGDPLGMTACVPVPVATLVSWSRDIARNGPRVEDEIDAVLRDQVRIQGLYLKTAEEKSLIEPG